MTGGRPAGTCRGGAPPGGRRRGDQRVLAGRGHSGSGGGRVRAAVRPVRPGVAPVPDLGLIAAIIGNMCRKLAINYVSWATTLRSLSRSRLTPTGGQFDMTSS